MVYGAAYGTAHGAAHGAGYGVAHGSAYRLAFRDPQVCLSACSCQVALRAQSVYDHVVLVVRAIPQSEVLANFLQEIGEKCGEISAKFFADFRPSISRENGRKKSYEKSSTFSTVHEIKFFHCCISGGWVAEVLVLWEVEVFLRVLHSKAGTQGRVCQKSSVHPRSLETLVFLGVVYWKGHLFWVSQDGEGCAVISECQMRSLRLIARTSSLGKLEFCAATVAVHHSRCL